MSKSIKINAICKTLMSILNILFPLITAPYIARILSVGGFTEYNRAQSIMTWFSPFAVFGIYTYGMRTISQIKNNEQKVSELFSSLFFINIFTSAIVTFAYTLIALNIGSFKEYKNIYLVMSFQLLFTCLATDWANEAFEVYGFILIKTFICRLIYVVSIFLFVKTENDLLLYVLLTTLSLVLNNTLTFCYAKSKIKFSKIRINESIKLLKPLFIVFLLVNSSMLYTVFDRFVLTWFGSKLDLTYYNTSQILIMSIINVTSSILLVSIPRLSFYWGNGNYNDYQSLLKKSCSTFLAINTPCCFGLALLSSELIYLYASDKYLAANSTFFLFAIRYFISGFDMILSKQVLLSTGNERHLTRIYYIGGIYNIVIKIILILSKNLTPELCVITTATADIAIIVLQLLQIRKLNIKIPLFSLTNLKYLLSSVVFCILGFLTKKKIPMTDIKSVLTRILIIIPTCIFIYGAMLILTKDGIIMGIPAIEKLINHKRKEKY